MNVILDVVGDSVLKLFDEYDVTRHRSSSTRLTRQNRRDRLLSEKKIKDRSAGRDALKRTVSTDSSYEYTVSSSSMTETLGATTATSFAGRTGGTSVAQSTIGSRECLWLKHQRSSSVSRARVPLSSSVVAPSSRRRDVSFDTPSTRTGRTKMQSAPIVPRVSVERPVSVTRNEGVSYENPSQRAVIEPKQYPEVKTLLQQNGATRTDAVVGKPSSEKSDDPLPRAMPSQGPTSRPSSEDNARPPTPGTTSHHDQPAGATLNSNENSFLPNKLSPQDVTRTDDSYVVSASTPPMSHRKHKHRLGTHQMTNSAPFQPIIEEDEAESNEEELIAQVDDLLTRVQEAEAQGRMYMQELKKLQLALKELDPSRDENKNQAFNPAGVPAQVVDDHRLGRSRPRNAAYFRRGVKIRDHCFLCTNIIPDSFASCGRIFRSSAADNMYYSPEPPIVYREGRDMGAYYAEYEHPVVSSSRGRRVMYHPDHLMVPHLDYAEAEPVQWLEQNPQHRHAKQHGNFDHQRGIFDHQRGIADHQTRPMYKYSSGAKQGVTETRGSENNRFAQFYGDRSMLSSVGAEGPKDHANLKSFEGRTLVIYPRMDPEQTNGEAAMNASYHQSHPQYTSVPVMQNTA